MYTSVDFNSKIAAQRGVPCPTNKGVSYTNLVSLLAVTLKIDYYYYYHPQTNRQMERVNQVLEDMLRMYVMDQPGKWEDYLHLVEFVYDNHFQDSSGLSQFEILYG